MAAGLPFSLAGTLLAVSGDPEGLLGPALTAFPGTMAAAGAVPALSIRSQQPEGPPARVTLWLRMLVRATAASPAAGDPMGRGWASAQGCCWRESAGRCCCGCWLSVRRCRRAWAAARAASAGKACSQSDQVGAVLGEGLVCCGSLSCWLTQDVGEHGDACQSSFQCPNSSITALAWYHCVMSRRHLIGRQWFHRAPCGCMRTALTTATLGTPACVQPCAVTRHLLQSQE